MTETSPPDNSVKVELDIDQVEAGRPLSTAQLSISYPGIARNLGNAVSYDSALALLLQAIEWHLQQMSMYTPDELPHMTWWLNNVAGKFIALADKYSTPQSSGLAAPPPAVPGK